LTENAIATTEAAAESPMGSTAGSLSMAGAHLPPMSFHVPDGIHAVTLPLHDGERAAAVAALVRDIYPNGNEELWEGLGELYGSIADEMVGSGVGFTGIGLYDIGEAGIAHCSLMVAALETGHEDPDVAAQGLQVTLASEPMHDVRWVDLPCGPAVSCITIKSLVIEGNYTNSGEDTQLITGQIQVYVPFPSGMYTAVFAMDTAAMDQWNDFSTMMANIVRSVQFPVQNEELTATDATPPTGELA
jgi:hypothetical protein